MLLKFARAAMIMALCFSLGAHWIALQSVAWGAMIVQYSHHTSLAEAVARTFDGDHPCDLCKRITHAQQSEKQQQAKPAPLKPDLIRATRTVVVIPPAEKDFPYSVMTMSASVIAHLPAVPPPRSELA